MTADGPAHRGRLDDVRVERALGQEARPCPASSPTCVKTSMNSRPMILRLRSGSVTPAQLREEAARGVHEHHLQLQPLREALADLRAPRPCAAGRCPRTRRSAGRPTAAWTSSAATAESTPPESAQSTRSVADRRADLRHRLLDERGRRSSRAGSRRCRGSSRARSCRARCASPPGWNRMPKMRRSRCSIAATGLVALEPVTAKPGRRLQRSSRRGSSTRASASARTAKQSASVREISNSAWPYSRAPSARPSPPSTWLMSCMP